MSETIRKSDTIQPVLGQEELHFRKIFEHSNDAILIVDPAEERILDANPRASQMLGFDTMELLATPVSSVHAEDMPAFRHFAKAVLDSESGWTDELSWLTKSGDKLSVEISASTIDIGGKRCLIAMARDASERKSMEQALRTIVEGTATATGEAFFYSLVRELAHALGVRCAFVAEYVASDKRRLHTLAYWNNGDFVDNREWNLAGTPCEIVARGETVYYTHKVHELFPADRPLATMGIESYFGVPFVTGAGMELGHLAVMHDQPMAKEFRGMALLKIFAVRATVELERKRAEQALRRSEERLANILASATDAILTIDADHGVTLFNTAAEKMFRCKAADIIGQSFESIFSRRFSNLLKGYFLAVHPAAVNSQQLWAPEGLTACRFDGEEFPVEATISPLEVSGQRLYTVIMRDLTERKKAEEMLGKLQRENILLQEAVKTERNFGAMIGDSQAIKNVFKYAEQVAGTDSTVLLTGETGTGKGVIARAIHDLSPRKDRFFVNVNCAALPGELVESELFGHEKGAFTGATAQRKGRFELADGGTIFLDEVGELTASTQAKLLRVLQDHEFERVGGTHSIRVNVRVIAATNRNLTDMVKAGGFRSDLFYRLNVFPVQMPALRERKSDMALLARHFLGLFAKRMGKPVKDLSPAALERLMRYPWPGNVRELQNVIERAVILASGPLLEIDDALELRLEDKTADSPPGGTLEEMERNYILKVLQECQWVIEGELGASSVLGLKPSTLRSRMQKLNIRKPT